MMRWRLRRVPAEAAEPVVEYVQVDSTQLQGMFAAPTWLRDAGTSAWLLVGVTLLLVGVIWLLSLTATIVMPLLTAGIIAAVTAPLVTFFGRVGIPRGIASILVLVLIIVTIVALMMLIIGGITQQTDTLSGQLTDAKTEIQSGLEQLGIDQTTAQKTTEDGGTSAQKSVSGLIDGVASGIGKVASLAFFIAMTALILVFLLIDGPRIRHWVEGRMGVPEDVACVITRRMLQSLRGYFLGVTIVAAWNALLVSVGALILGVPMVGTLAVVTFVAAYIPYLGAWSAGIFAVLIALGSAGPEAAVGMAVVQILSNGVLQQIVQPLAYGAALGIHPLAVLIVTIAGGALFGAPGLILGAPVTSAIVRITADLAANKETEVEAAGADPPGAGAPALA